MVLSGQFLVKASEFVNLRVTNAHEFNKGTEKNNSDLKICVVEEHVNYITITSLFEHANK